MEPNENQNSDQQTNSTNSQNLNEEDQSTETSATPPTPAQNQNQNELDEARSSNREVLDIYDRVLREQQAELQRLRNEAQERNRPAPLSADEQKQKFFSNPMDVLREEISNAVKPLMEFTQSFKQQSEYDRLKDKYRNDPRYKDIFPHIESYVDQILANADKNEQSLRTAVLVAIGAAQTGEIKLPSQNRPTVSQSNNQPNNTPQNNNMTVPAHLRSTPPTPPSNNNQVQAPTLTELEKRLARELGMTPEQYVRYREMPSHEVATAEVK